MSDNHKISDIFIEELIKKLATIQGIYVHNIRSGSLIIVETANSNYLVAVTRPDGSAVIQGGVVEQPTLTLIHGSTFGGSMIKTGWIGKDMCFEFWLIDEKRVVTTTRVQSIKIEEISETAVQMLQAVTNQTNKP